MYRLFIWSTAQPDDTAQGILDLYNLESAVNAYLFIHEVGMRGRDKITYVELYKLDDTGEIAEQLYSSTFPD